jgi:pimeloyl-ACP methyl ester carboxylesterase
MQTIQSKDGTTLAFDTYGSGPVLIYVTGAVCFRSFKPVMKDARTLGERFTTINYDRRGRGDSGDTSPYAIEREVEDIEALIDAVGGRASLYGHSSGAVLALEAALQLPNKIDNLVIHDAAYVHDESEKLSYGQFRQQVLQLLNAGHNAAAIKTFLKGIGMPRAFVWLLPLFPGWKTMIDLAPTLAYDLTPTKDLPPLQRAESLVTPALIMVGEKCPPGMREVAARLAQAIPHAQFEQLAGQNHMADAKTLMPSLASFFKLQALV